MYSQAAVPGWAWVLATTTRRPAPWDDSWRQWLAVRPDDRTAGSRARFQSRRCCRGRPSCTSHNVLGGSGLDRAVSPFSAADRPASDGGWRREYSAASGVCQTLWMSTTPRATSSGTTGRARKPREIGPQLVFFAAGVARHPDRCAIAHRIPADPAVSAALRPTRRTHARGLCGDGDLLDRGDDRAGLAGGHASVAVPPTPPQPV